MNVCVCIFSYLMYYNNIIRTTLLAVEGPKLQTLTLSEIQLFCKTAALWGCRFVHLWLTGDQRMLQGGLGKIFLTRET